MINQYIESVGKDSLKYLLSRIIPAIIAFISILFFTKLLGPQKYGDYSIILGIISIFVIFTQSWIENSTIRFYPHGKNNTQVSNFVKTIIVALIFDIILFTIFFLIAILILNANNSYKYYVTPALFGMLSFWSMTLVHTLNSVYRARQEAKNYTINIILFSVGKFTFAITLIYLVSKSIEMIFLGIFLSGIIITLMMFRNLENKIKISIGKFSKEKLIECFSYGWPLTLVMISSWILSLFNQYVLKINFSSVEVGIYSATYNLTDKSMQFLFMGLMLAVYPALVKAWEIKGKEFTAILLRKFIRYYFILCLPVITGWILLGKPILNIFTSEDFRTGVEIIPYIGASSFLLGLNQYFTKPIELEKKTKLLAKIMISAGLINVILAFILIPMYGMKGAALSTLIAYIYLTIVNLVISKRFLKYRLPSSSIIKIVIATGVMGVTLFILKRYIVFNLIHLVLIISFAVIVYFLALYLLGDIHKTEIIFLRNVLSTKK
jgi:O-antigen/teichoic acid export membrane protein